MTKNTFVAEVTFKEFTEPNITTMSLLTSLMGLLMSTMSLLINEFYEHGIELNVVTVTP